VSDVSEETVCPGCGETLTLQDDVCNVPGGCPSCNAFPMEYVHANGTPECDQ
jgi:hypothetical protein